MIDTTWTVNALEIPLCHQIFKGRKDSDPLDPVSSLKLCIIVILIFFFLIKAQERTSGVMFFLAFWRLLVVVPSHTDLSVSWDFLLSISQRPWCCLLVLKSPSDSVSISIHGPTEAFSTLMAFGSKEIFCLHQTVRTSRENATRSMSVFSNLPDLLDELGRSLLFAFDGSLNLVLHD